MVQHELTPRVGLAAGYYRRDDGNRMAVDNTLVTNADYTGPFCITAPANADLPGGGGYPICGLYDITPTARGLQQNYTTFASNFGDVHQPVSGRRRQREHPAGRRHVHQHRRSTCSSGCSTTARPTGSTAPKRSSAAS